MTETPSGELREQEEEDYHLLGGKADPPEMRRMQEEEDKRVGQAVESSVWAPQEHPADSLEALRRGTPPENRIRRSADMVRRPAANCGEGELSWRPSGPIGG